jgi:3-deoxy-manno-octulosonate cytidylyltransferase (CMP-KDO synthetase)
VVDGVRDADLKRIPRAEIVVVIPARYASSRFPGKPLATLNKKPLIQHVYERVRAARGVKQVVIATDDPRIVKAAQAFGGDALMTGPGLRTGSDRVAHVAREISADVYINLQGDEIPLSPALLEDLILPFLASDAEVGTLKRAISQEQELIDPNVVKVITDRQGDALYFSRSPIPYVRDQRAGEVLLLAGLHWKHLGIYAYTSAALARFSGLPTGSLEGSEQLEQLRLLEAGERIRVWETKQASLRIDTPADLKQAEAVLTRGEPAWQNSSL